MENRPPQSYPRPKSVSAPKPAKLPDLDASVKAVALMHGITRSKVASILGMSQPGLIKALKARDPRTSMLMALCEALQYNFFDLYMRQLPEHLRSSTETSQLQEQVEQLEAEKQALQLKIESYEREREMMQAFMKMKS